MSVLIKGIEMPTNCYECEFVDILPTCPCQKMADEDFWNNVSLAVEGHKDCPLVPVPPHGRLIDADRFKERMDFICDAGGCLEPVTKSVREFVKHWIDAQEDVIPSEESE